MQRDIETKEPPTCYLCGKILVNDIELEEELCVQCIQAEDERELQEKKHPDDPTKH